MFVDFKGAYNSLNHKILCEKLNHYGIRGVENKWFENYLEDRIQYVIYNNSTIDAINTLMETQDSTWKDINSGDSDYLDKLNSISSADKSSI